MIKNLYYKIYYHKKNGMTIKIKYIQSDKTEATLTIAHAKIKWWLDKFWNLGWSFKPGNIIFNESKYSARIIWHQIHKDKHLISKIRNVLERNKRPLKKRRNKLFISDKISDIELLLEELKQ